MLPELGNFALILALCFALLQTVSLVRPSPSVQRLALGQCFFIVIAFFILEVSFIVNDFSVKYVFENSSTALPLFYRLSALWGAHEGSMLLWILILAGWESAVVFFSQSLLEDFRARVLGVMGFISAGFLLFILTTSNPFLRISLDVPTQGQDLNALLQDPGLIFHPPLLYMGYVGFSVPFAFAIGALLTGRLESTWAKWVRPWTLASWCFLTLGVTAGSWWSYRELGWGGWWSWDPVENASFMPWLSGTALIHSLIVSEKRNAFHHWTILLAICTFALSLLGTFLVRSGILISVHAFAIDPARGVYLLNFLLIVIGLALLVYAVRARKIQSPLSFMLISRESFLLFNNVLLFTAMATVLLGTLYPVILAVLGLQKISVGAPYFNSLFIPLSMMILFCMGIGPMCHWGKMPWQQLQRPLIISFLLSIVFGFFISVSVAFALFAMMPIFRHMWVTRKTKPSGNRLGMWFAHIGVGVCVIGIAMSSMHSIERNVRMAKGNSAKVGDYIFHLQAIDPITGPNYSGVSGKFLVTKNDVSVTTLEAQNRLYTQSQTAMPEAAIDVGIFRDLYVVMAEPLDQQSWAVRIYDKPFIRWIWIGGGLIFFGGLCALSSRKFYVPVRKGG